MEFFQVQISWMRQNANRETPQCTSQRLPMSTIGTLWRNALVFNPLWLPSTALGYAMRPNRRLRLRVKRIGPSESREFCNFSGGTHLEQIVDLKYFAHIDRTLPLRLKYINVLI